jgi:hypothetical protein
MTSSNGVDWVIPRNSLFSRRQLRFEDGTLLSVAHLERSQLLVDSQGISQAFYAACSIDPANGKTDRSTFNVRFKMQIQ